MVAALGLCAAIVLTLVIFGLPVGSSLEWLVQGAVGSKFAVARTLIKAIPLCLTSVGIVISWRAGMFNIGGEGQLIMGAICGAAVAQFTLSLEGPARTAIIVLACIAGGAGYALFAGWLMVARGVHIVISTILLNFVALHALGWVAAGPLQESSGKLPLTQALGAATMFGRPDRQTDLHAGGWIVLLIVVLVAVGLFRTRGGFELRVTGENPRVARANKIDVVAIQLRSVAISGGLCGLAGAMDYVGVTGQIGPGFSQNWGFLAIPVALIGGLNPYGAAVSSLVFGGLFAGSENLARFTRSGATLVFIIQAVVVLGYLAIQKLQERRVVREGDA
ncbi:MAG: ABC transporter permease [Fimbriimonadaceae bacterium]